MSTASFHFYLFGNRNNNDSSTVFGCFYIFSGLYKVFTRHKATSREQSLCSANCIMGYVAEGKYKGFLSLCVQRLFDYSDGLWPLLRDVEIKPR